MIRSKDAIKSFFEDGDRPNQDQFRDLIDSSVGRVIVSLPSSSLVVTDLSTGNLFKILVGCDMTLQNPVGGIDGNSYMWRLRQDEVGGHSISLGDKFRLPAGCGPLGWSTTPNALDIFVAQYDAEVDLFYVLSMIPGY